MMALLASFLIATNATPAELVMSCRTMVPSDVELDGRIILRNRKGFAQAEYGYVLTRCGGETDLVLRDSAGAEVPFEREGRILGTDVTWSDITLDYLWWDDFSFDAEREAESVHGQKCAVVVMKKGDRTVRVWVDRKTGALMQAEVHFHIEIHGLLSLFLHGAPENGEPAWNPRHIGGDDAFRKRQVLRKQKLCELICQVSGNVFLQQLFPGFRFAAGEKFIHEKQRLLRFAEG